MRTQSLFLLFVCMLLLGCGGKGDEKKDNKTGDSDKKDTGQKKPAEPKKLNVQVKSWDETLELVASKEGKVVVMDLWALW